jgi:mxaJ protein
MLSTTTRRSRTLITTIALWALGGAIGSSQAPELRICGDPDNLPFSNQKLEGFENRIAAVVAEELGAKPAYTWWPHQRGLVKNTLDTGACDVLFGVPQGLDTVLWTKPYYRTSYVLAYRRDRGYRIRSLDAPELKELRIGAYLNTPPEESLARRGLLAKTSAYSLYFDPAGDRDRPVKLLEDLAAGTIDVAIPWGPLAGYYAKKMNVNLDIVPLQDEAGVPLGFDIAMGVKKGNREFKERLEAAIDRRAPQIRAILEDFGVPLLPVGTATASPVPAARQDAAPPLKPSDAPQASASDAAKKNPLTGNAAAIEEGQKLYFQVGCQGCHGGGGGGGMATSLIDESWKFGSNDEILYKLIKGQIPEQTMPIVYSALPDDQVWKMLAFIRSVYKGDPSKIDW